ncbi:uncharacterized protein TNCV_4590741 [Trichonephila clavipes]|nr:uncharacterized protein TNCV_4590741 [Trichonephila clavipes]
MKFPKKLVIALYNYSQITEIYRGEDGAYKLGGVDGKLLDILSQTLKFRYELISAPDGEWGSLSPSGNWTGLIGLVSRGQTDAAIGFLGTTQERLGIVDFSEPYTMDELSFATHLPGTVSRTYSYFYAFQWNIWVCIFAVWLILPFLFYIQTHKKYSYFGLLFQMCRFLLRQNMSKFAVERKYFFSLWLYFAFVISSCYMAMLFSIMTIQYKEIPIQDFKELFQAVSERRYRVMSPQSIAKHLLSFKEDYIVGLGDVLVENKWFTKLGHSLDEENFDGKTAVLGVKIMFGLRFGKPPYATKYVSDAILSSVDVGLAIRKDFCCKKALDSAITRIKRAGLYLKFLNDEMYKTWIKTSKKSYKSTIKRISLNNLCGALAILLLGFGLATIVLIIEICFEHSLTVIFYTVYLV